MFAVIKSGGKQYKVAKDDVIQVEKINGEAGATIQLSEVLMIGDNKNQTVGFPLIEGATVAATILEQMRGQKTIVFKKKRRQNYRRRNGHRQHLTLLRISEILLEAKKTKSRKKAPPKKAEKKINTPDAEQILDAC